MLTVKLYIKHLTGLVVLNCNSLGLRHMAGKAIDGINGF